MLEERSVTMIGTAIAVVATAFMAYVTFAGSSTFEMVRTDAKLTIAVQTPLVRIADFPGGKS